MTLEQKFFERRERSSPEMKLGKEIFNRGEKLHLSGLSEEAFSVWLENEHAYEFYRSSNYPREFETPPLWEKLLVKLNEGIAEKHALSQFVVFDQMFSLLGTNLLSEVDEMENHLAPCKLAFSWGSLNASLFLGLFLVSKIDDDDAVLAAGADGHTLNTEGKKYEEMIGYLILPAEKNFPHAQDALGTFYHKRQHYEQAIYWYKRAIENGENSYYELGKCYRDLNIDNVAVAQELMNTICVQGYLETECHKCAAHLAFYFNDFNPLAKTKEEVQRACEYFHRYGFYLHSLEDDDSEDDDVFTHPFADHHTNTNKKRKRTWLRLIKQFYDDNKTLIDFEEEYRKMLAVVTSDKKQTTNKGNLTWASSILIHIIISWPELHSHQELPKELSPFHPQGKSYLLDHREKLAATISYCTNFPAVIIDICCDYLFATPQWMGTYRKLK